jgi:prevent-host-death family protein
VHVAIRELKAGLSRVLARARAGEVIEVTSHNRPIARIVGIPDAEAGLRRLVASGAAAWTGGKPAFAPPVPLAAGGSPTPLCGSVGADFASRTRPRNSLR